MLKQKQSGLELVSNTFQETAEQSGAKSAHV